MRKKGLALLLTLVMIISIFPATAFGLEFSDIPNNWSTAALEKAVENGLLKGNNGKIMPDENLTRAQMATIVNRVFGTIEKSSIDKFTDVEKGDWYYDEMAKAVQMKIFVGSGNKLNPNSYITREEAFVALARAFKISGAKDNILDKFSDETSISNWAKDGVSSLVSAGYVAGSNGHINPKKNITRAEFAQIMDNVIKTYINEDGTYTTDYSGNVMINVANVVLEDLTITGDLIIGDGVGDGNVTLDGVTVIGRTIIRGGGEHSVRIIGNSNIQNIIIARVDGKVRVYSEDGTEVGDVIIDGNDDVIIEGDVGVVTIVAADVTVTATNANIASASIQGENSNIIIGKTSTIKEVTIDAGNSNVEVLGKITNIITTNQAQNAEINVSTGAKVGTVIINSQGAIVKGSGSVQKVAANANNVAVTTPNTSVTAANGATGVTAGESKVEPGKTETTTTKTKNNGGNNHDSTVAVSAITVTGSAIVVTGQTLQLGVDITPANATNKTVTWSVTNGTGSATIDSLAGVLTATGIGTVTVTATNSASGVTGTKVITITADVDLMLQIAKYNESQLIAADYAGYSAVTSALALPETTNAEKLAKATAINNAIAALEFAGQANLNAAKAAESQLTATDYVEYSAVTIALALPETTNAQMEAKTIAINNAIAALEFAGQADLNAAKAAEAMLTSTNYVDYSAVTAALVLPETTNAEKLAKATAINDAIAALEFAGQANLNAAKAAESQLTATDYVDYSAVTIALALPETTNTQMEAKTTAINNAIAALVTVADANLAAALSAEGLLSPADYTDYSAVTTALALPETTNAEKLAKATAINDAIAALEFAGQANLNAAKAAESQLTATGYVDYSAVTIALALPETTNTQMEAKTTAINNAIAALEFAGQADLNAVKAAEAMLTSTNYVDYSAVTAALALPETTNAEIVIKVTAINNAIAALEFLGQANLNAAKVAESQLTATDYVDYSAVTTALALPETTNVQVEAKTTAINNAIAALEFAGQADLNAAKAAEALLTSTNYVDYSAVTAALALPETTNAEIVIKVTAIKNAITALEFVGQANLNAAKAAESQLTATDYIDYSAVTTALALPETTNAQMEAKTTAINNAIAALVTVADANLAAALSAEELLSPADYTDYSAVTTALALPETTNAEKQAKATAINNAIAALEFAGQANLNAAKAAVTLLTSTDYVNYSAVTTALGLPETTNTEVVAKTTAINDAIVALEFAGQADLNVAKAAEALLTSTNYVDYSAVTAALALPETTNAEVVAKTVAINNAIADLELLTIESKQITNFNYETTYATQARQESKVINSLDFASNPKQFTISDGTNIININLNWDATQSGLTTGQMMGSVIDSFIQGYCNANNIDLGNRTMTAMGFSDTFFISTFKTGSTAQITLGGNDWNEFFTNQSFSGADEDTSKNRRFSISDGTNSVEIVLEYDYLDMDGLVDDINWQIDASSVSAIVEKVDGSHFKIVPQTGAKTITIDGTDKAEFFQ